MVINISITNKRPTVIGTPVITCGNSDYSIKFAFDSDWAAFNEKKARFVYAKRGVLKFQDVPFSGDIVAVPILSGTREVMVGVYAGDLRTTTPARIPCEYSILCPDAEEQIGAVDAADLQDQIGDLSQLKTGDSGSLVDAINWLFENGTIGDGGGCVWVGSEEPPDDSYTVWIDPAGSSSGSSGSGGNLDAYVEGETLVFTESSTATIEDETLIL